MRGRVIALGQPVAGDDGVGMAVLDALRERGVPRGVELCAAAEATALIPLLETSGPVVIVDAVIGGNAPGSVLSLTPEALEARGLVPLSTHGIGVVEAVEIARAVAPSAVSSALHVVGITIERPTHYRHGLSPAVAHAVPRAVATVLALLDG